MDGAPRPTDARLEIATALVLSAAAMVTSWSGYQAALWDGEQAAHYSQANAVHMAAARAATRAGQLQALDVMAFSEWADAHAGDRRDLEDFYRARFRPEFVPAFERWRASDPLNNPAALPTPFVDPAYRGGAEARWLAMEKDATRLFDQGQQDNGISDRYVQGGLILASALFFGGMCQVFRTPAVRLGLILVAALACVIGAFRIFTLPVQTL